MFLIFVAWLILKKNMEKNSGMLPLTYDNRDERFSKIAFGAPRLSPLPASFMLAKRRVRNQGASYSCTAHATTGASEYQEGVELSPAWHWMKICEKMGNYIPAGTDPRTAMSISCKLGDVQEPAQFSFETHNAQEIGNWTQWPNTDAAAEEHMKAAYVPVPMVGDYFDSVRATLFKGLAVMAYGTWSDSWATAVIPEVPTPISSLHAYIFVGFDGEYLILRNSYGVNFGDRGYQRMPRVTVNREFAKYGTGCFTWVDLTPEQIARAKEDSLAGQIQRAIINAWQKLAIYLNR